MNKIREIVTAWAISFSPTEEQKAKAEQRLEICQSCENAGQGPLGPFCKLCGCAFRAKVFTPVQNGCPAGKWNI